MYSVKIISNDLTLYSIFSSTSIDIFSSVVVDTVIGSENDTDIIIVSDKCYSINKFLEIFDIYLKKTKHVFYIVSDSATANVITNMSILTAKGIHIIPYTYTPNQIFHKVCSMFSDTSISVKNIVTFFGSDSKVGTTITAQAVAETLAAGVYGNIFLCFLNGSPSRDYYNTDNFVSGLDSLKVKIMNEVLTGNELIDTCVNIGNLYILPGVDNIFDVRHYHPKHVEYLINLASKNFSAVIIDAGSRIDYLLSVGALNCTSLRYLVTTQQDSAWRNYQRISEQVFPKVDIDPKSFLLIVNKYINSSELYTASQIAEMYKSTLAGTLPYVDYGWQAERDKKTLLNYDNREYNDKLGEIAKVISAQLSLDFNYSEPKKNFLGGVFKWLKK